MENLRERCLDCSPLVAFGNEPNKPVSNEPLNIVAKIAASPNNLYPQTAQRGHRAVPGGRRPANKQVGFALAPNQHKLPWSFGGKSAETSAFGGQKRLSCDVDLLLVFLRRINEAPPQRSFLTIGQAEHATET
jgi:hypothetical protein